MTWVDSNNNVFELIPGIIAIFPALLQFSISSYFLRYVRWHGLLYRAGFNIAAGFGFLAYISGFAFTVTPRKVGELVRVRYLKQLGVPYYSVISAFIFERAFDLVVVFGKPLVP